MTTAPAITVTRIPGAGGGRLFGVLLTVNLRGCDYRVVGDPHEMVNIVGLLIEKIGMRPYGPPLIQKGREDHFGTGDLTGWTIVQLIETSSIVVHANDIDQTVFIDAFTCGSLDPETVAAALADMFGADACTATFLERRVP